MDAKDKQQQQEIEDSPSLKYFLNNKEEFQVDYDRFKKKIQEIGLIINSDEERYNEHSKVVCDKCTKTFFEVFYQEYTEQETELGNVDPILKDILSQKVFMKYDGANKQFICPNNPEHRENFRDTIIDKPDKKLKAAGMDMYAEYDRYNKDEDGGDFIAGVNRFKN